MTEANSISNYRSEVIERTINVDGLMNAIISQHYFHCILKDFMLEVLYDEYFSFGLKRRIVEKLIDKPCKKKIQNLNRINTIRNYFAHCGQEWFVGESPPPPGSHGIVPDPRKPHETIDFKKLYDEFMDIIGDVEKYLGDVYQLKGGQLHEFRNGHLLRISNK